MVDVVSYLSVGIVAVTIAWCSGATILVWRDDLHLALDNEGWHVMLVPFGAWAWLLRKALSAAWGNFGLLVAGFWLGEVPLQLLAFSRRHEWANAALAIIFAVGAYCFWRQQKALWDLKAKKQASMRSALPSPSSFQSLNPYPTLPPAGWKSPYASPKRSQPKDEPVIGFRVWDVIEENEVVQLTAVNPEFGAWQPGANLAECKRHVGMTPTPRRVDWHRAPMSSCGCGFWLKNTLWGAYLMGRMGRMIGVAQGWGHVIEHEDGWRVQYASVIALAIFGGDHLKDAAAKAIGLRYEVPVMGMTQLQQYEAEPTLMQGIARHCPHCGWKAESWSPVWCHRCGKSMMGQQ